MTMLRKLTMLVLCALLLAAAQPSLAQKTGPNGGLLAGKEDHQTELVVSATELAVYILDHGKVHDTKGVKIRAVIQHAGKTTSIDLVAADGKKMIGKLTTPIGKGAIVVLTGKDDHGDVITARYVLN
jgi:hypothetical protein